MKNKITIEFEKWRHGIKQEYQARSKILVSGTIIGHLPRLENRRQPMKINNGATVENGKIKTTKRTIFAKSKEARQYEKFAIPQMRSHKRFIQNPPLNEFVDIFIRVFCRTPVINRNAQDLNGELFYNCMEKAGVIEDDRLFVGKHLRRMYDKQTPRVEFIICTPAEDYG